MEDPDIDECSFLRSPYTNGRHIKTSFFGIIPIQICVVQWKQFWFDFDIDADFMHNFCFKVTYMIVCVDHVAATLAYQGMIDVILLVLVAEV